jgi:hypothetical protein
MQNYAIQQSKKALESMFVISFRRFFDLAISTNINKLDLNNRLIQFL